MFDTYSLKARIFPMVIGLSPLLILGIGYSLQFEKLVSVLSSFGITAVLSYSFPTKAFDSSEWLFEIKWDGYGAIAEIHKKGNSLYSRNGLTFDKAYPKIFNDSPQSKQMQSLMERLSSLMRTGNHPFRNAELPQQ